MQSINQYLNYCLVNVLPYTSQLFLRILYWWNQVTNSSEYCERDIAEYASLDCVLNFHTTII